MLIRLVPVAVEARVSIAYVREETVARRVEGEDREDLKNKRILSMIAVGHWNVGDRAFLRRHVETAGKKQRTE